MINAFICDNGQLRPLTETGSTEALRQTVWIDLRNATPDEIERVEHATGLTVPYEADVSEI